MTGYKADHDLVVEVLRGTEVLSCFPDGLPHDPVLFRAACEAAADKVPFIRQSFNKNRQDERNIKMRLAEAITYRNKWYRDNLPKGASNVAFRGEFVTKGN